MSLINIYTPDFSFADERGVLTQLTRGGYKQINAVFSKKGAIRGGFHYHKFNKEVFFVISGRVKVRARLNGKTEEHEFGNGDMFGVDELVQHNFTYLEDTSLVVMYTNNVELSDGTKDIFNAD